jgi:hypothetical protein
LKFDKLNEMIPYVTGGKQKVLSMSPYNAITLRLPGRHAKDTTPEGGDFVVCVDDEGMGWIQHQFTHTDLFNDLQAKMNDDSELTELLLEHYSAIIRGGAPTTWWDAVPNPVSGLQDRVWTNTLHPQTFLYAVQCLAVAEHRRYERFETKFGGRYLPFRFAAGIVEELWTAQEASEKQKYGRPAVERLERERGVPALTKELMS